MINILLIEDDQDLNRTVCRHLSSHGYFAKGCLSAQEGYDAFYEKKFDLIISDIMMPGEDGFAFAENVRRTDRNIPILFMTARGDFTSKEQGYRLGIDDYMVKPVDLNELQLHIEALLRRANIAANKKLVIGDLVLNEDEVTATLSGQEVPLTLREFRILFKLLSYPKHIFTRTQLLDEFSRLDSDSSLRTVDVYITNLRNKFAACNSFQIVTVRGLGYKAVLA